MSFVGIRKTIGIIDSSTGGPGTLSGITKINGEVTGKQRVFLLLRDSMRLRRETWSDSSGNYSFHNLNLSLDWLIVSVDQTKTYRTEVIDRLAA